MLSLEFYPYLSKSSCLDQVAWILFLFLFFSLAPLKKTIGRIENSFENSVYKIKALNPSDISSVFNSNEGIYFFWKEGRSTIESKVYYAYVDFANKSKSQILKENISQLSIVQNYPKAVSYISTDVILAWKDYTNQSTGDLYMQRVSKNQLIWNKPGIKINNSPNQILDYSISSDKAGNIFAAYLSRSEFPSNNYEINYQRVLSNGSLAYQKDAVMVESSARLKSNLKVIYDNNGGAYVLWTEKVNEKESILIKRIDPSGRSVFGNRPIKISGTIQNVKNFSVKLVNRNLLYIAWESSDKNIYHQLINSSGKAVWTVGGAKAVFTKGINFSPKIIDDDSVITLSWLNTFYKRYSICIQKFKANGKEIWPSKKVFAVTINEPFENYSVSKDSEGGYYVAFLYLSKKNDECCIGIQKISSKGNAIWDSTNCLVSFNPHCSNNHLNTFVNNKNLPLISYSNSSGDIVVEPMQKIHKTEDEFLNLHAELNDKSVKLMMNTNVVDENYLIVLERQFHSDTNQTVWKLIGTIESKNQSSNSEYQYTDNPNDFGTLYYRALLKNKQKELTSNIARIDFLEAASKIIIAQNNPNPFRDSTVISFYLPASAFVGIEFFNDNAEKVRELPEREFPAGQNSITFHSDGLNPGIYFYKFYTKEFVEVKKMVVE